MSDLILREWNNKAIRQRNDGYFSATDMCRSCNKLFGNWNQLNSTKEYIEALQNKHYCDSNNGQFIESNVGGTPETTGTWVHRKVALRLAQWLSPEFAVQVDDWVEELLLKGSLTLSENKQHKTSKMSLSQIDWIADRMVAEGALLPEDKLDFKFDKAIENFPEMASGIADARKLVADKNKANADYALACQQKRKQLLYSDFIKQLNRLSEKKGKKALLTSDLSGLSLMQRKDFLEKYGAKGAKRLNKPEIIRIWQEMHDLELGCFDKVAGTFESAI